MNIYYFYQVKIYLFLFLFLFLTSHIYSQTGVQFDGVNDYITFGQATSELGATIFTLECWFKRTGTGGKTTTGGSPNGVNAVPLITKGRGEGDGLNSTIDMNYFLGIGTDQAAGGATSDVLVADFEDLETTPSTLNNNHTIEGVTPILNDVWYHAAAVFDGTDWYLYLNGSLENTVSGGGTTPTNISIQHAGIGTAMNSSGVAAGFFNGFIDEVRIWNVARTEQEIQDNINLELTSGSGLIGRWSLDDGLGTTAVNSIGGSPDGTLTNGPLWTFGAPFNLSFTPPDAPTGLIVTLNTALQVGLSWTDNSNNESSFDIERSATGSSSGFINIGSVAANMTTFSDNNINELTDYWYRIIATNAQGSSLPSNVVSVTTLEELDYALQFDGLDDFVTFGAAPELATQNFTVEIWFKKTGAGGPNTTGTSGIPDLIPLIAKGAPQAEGSTVDANYILGIAASSSVIAGDFEEGTGSTSPGLNHPLYGVTTIVDNVWYHAAITFNNGVFSLYLNGVLENSQGHGAGVYSQGGSIQYAGLATMLTSSGGQNGHFEGVLDEARIWSYARTGANIADSLTMELTTANGMIGRWGLNEGSGTNAVNSISGGSDGTLTNGPQWVTPGFPSSTTTIVSFQEGVNGYTGTVDNFLSTLNPNLVNGNATHFEWDRWEGGNQNMPSYGLLRFENIFGNGVNQIPGNASIASATLEFNITTDPGDQGTVNEATSNWDESSTFNSFPGDPEIQGTTIATAPGTAGTHNIDVTSSISSWVGNPSSNKGWILVPTGTDGTSALSSEDVTVQNRPKLTVSYTVPTSIPDAPVAIAASNINQSEFEANWQKSAQATNYRLDVSENSSFTSILTGYNDLNVGNTTSYTVTGLSLLTTYYYRVRAENVLGTSGISNTINVTTTDVADALFLDGTDTYVKVNDAPGLRLISFTVETWFKKQGPGKFATETGTGGLVNVIPLVTKGSAENEDPLIDINYFLCITSSNTIAADFEDHDNSQNYPVEGVTTINNNQWYHAAVTYDGTTMTIYLNGIFENSRNIGLPPAYESLTPVALGSNLQSNGNVHASYSGYFDGTLDEVRIWDYARSQSEIQSTINSQISSTQTGLIARWALDEGTGNSVLGSAGTTFNGTIINTNYQWVTGAPFNLGNAPFQPVLVSPANGETVTDFPDLQVTVTDPNADNLTVTFYGKEIIAGSVFNLIGLPDTQYYVSSLNGGLPAMLTSQTQWIVSNKDALNISYVAQLGDCVEHGDQFASEWQNADYSFSLLESQVPPKYPDGIPYGIAVGNHDQSPIGDPNGTTTFYNQYFGINRFNGRAYYGGHYASDNDNHYDLFTAGGMDFIVIYFEYGVYDAAVLNWADGLLTTYSDRRAITVTHHMINVGNPGSFSAQGQAIYDALKGHSNLFLMLGGHVTGVGEGQRLDTYNGNTVYSLLSDYQSYTNGGHGLLRIMEFIPASNMINVKTYSPYTGESLIDGDSQFSLNYDMTGSQQAPQADFEILAAINNVTSGSTASHTWTTGIKEGSTYQWYVELNDGTNTTAGPTWSFSTAAGLPVELSSFSASVQGSDINLNWKTETEVNNYGFDILRKTQEDEWVKIGFVNGHGNSNSPKEYKFTDKSPAGGKQFSYKLKQIDNDGQFSYSSVVEVIIAPNDFALYQNYPNPFNPTTTIKYSLPQESVVSIKVFDVLGSEVETLVSEKQEIGIYEIEFNASSFASGMYIYRMQAGSFVQIKKMMILK